VASHPLAEKSCVALCHFIILIEVQGRTLMKVQFLKITLQFGAICAKQTAHPPCCC
jgi:hypothetical protein